MKKLLWVSVLATTMLAGCQTPSGPAQTAKFEAEGWQSFSSARTGDGPGRIYRVAPDGQIFQVTELPTAPRSDEQQLYAVKRTSELSLKEVLKTIGVAQTELPLSVTAQLERKSNVETESVNGRREYLEDRDLTDKSLVDALTGIKIRQDNTYFLIRETLASNKLKFNISRDWLAQLGVEADIKKVVESKSDITWKDGNEVSLDATFDKPYRIWFKAERLNVKDGSLGMGPGQPPQVSRTAGDFEVRLPEAISRQP